MTMSPALPLAGRSAEADLCLHCRSHLPVGARDHFCCRGCRSVFTLLQSSGLDRYYALRGERTLGPITGEPARHEQPWLDALAIALSDQSGLHRFALDVQGIQCGACVWLMEALFKREADAYQVAVNPALGRMSCSVGPAFRVSDFVNTVESFGYRLGPANKQGVSENHGLLLRTGVCLALAVNTMLLSSSTYFGLSQGPLFDLVQSASFVMATLSALIGGSYFARRALAGLRRGVLHLDLPIALGMGLAYVGSAISLHFGGAKASYLDTVSVFIALMLVGRLLQERLVEKNRRSLLSTDGASALLTRRVRGGRTELVACAELQERDVLLVCPGEIVPVRARLDDARATCALDWISGESEPRSFAAGDTLVAGAINAGNSALRATALASFDRSDLDALLRDEPSGKARLRGDFWDRLARIYAGLVLVATAGGALAWALLGASLTEVLDVSTAVLVVTCPCAFGIATPLAYELAVAGLRRAGLFVRDGGFFERCARVQRIVFDKTGTLTTGSLELREPEVLQLLSREERGVLYDLSAQSNHPKSSAIARALAAHYPELALSGLPAIEVAGRGMECRRGSQTYRLGEPRWAGASTSSCGPVFGAQGRARAILETCEVARPDAAREAEALARDGYELWIASGDTELCAKAMGQALGLSSERVIGELTPEGKRALIERVDLGRNDTLMIGDGINDGPALLRAACSGTPAIDRPFVPARADFYYLTPGLSPVGLVLRVSRAVRRVVQNALWFALAYNVFAVALAYAGLMRPWLAAVLMPASSLVVLAYVVFSLSPRSSIWKSSRC
ncbi:MAG: Type cbb3 cytochrome oxidase biosis protein CcoI [Myxococcaceae bacterium]|nr:Type cbb3 cytochrome oxidase biosis protein CcoI [Myxococcaceae bacterium]